MERRRGALPVGNSMPNSVPKYLQLQQQTSFGSIESTDSNESFRTQVPLAFHLPQNHQSNSYAVGGNGFVPHAQTGSSGGLNPTSSPYIPQGNTPVLPSTGFSAQSWGAPFMEDGCNGGVASSYQQQQLGQQVGGMQYPGGNQYQQHQMQLGGPVGGMNSHLQSSFGNNMSPYGHFGAGGVAPKNLDSCNNATGQMGFTQFATPELAYANAASNQSFGMSYVAGVTQPVNQMYNVSANGTYRNPNGSLSFQATPNTMYDGQNNATSSFNSAPGNMYGNQNHVPNFKSGSRTPKLSTQGSNHNNNNNSSTMRFQKKSFTPVGRKERNNSYRGNTNRSSNSSTPTLGGPVQAPMGDARGLSPEKEISKSSTFESSRTHKNKVVQDTSAVHTPVSKSQPSNDDLSSEQRRTETKTPQLRSRRGQTIVSATEPIRKQSVSDWAVGVHKPSENGDMNEAEMKHRGSPVKGMGLMTLNEADPFISSAVVSSNPFDCITGGPFNVGFGFDTMSQELLTLTRGGSRNPTLAEALDPYNVPFSEYCRLAKSDSFGVIKIKNVSITILSHPSLANYPKIPYGTHRAEVLAFLGRNARILSESEYEPIHIIMERVTSKTLDCFVEFTDFGEAVSAVNRFENNRVGGRGRLGQRHVEVELSTQGALMKELFPKAKNVQWDGMRPHIVPRDPNDPYNSGFQGFIIKEELIMLLKHVESPQRVSALLTFQIRHLANSIRLPFLRNVLSVRSSV